MNQPQAELQKLLQHIDRLLEQAPDEKTRLELQQMRARLSAPEMQDMARELASARPARDEELVLEFHDPLLPMVVTAGASVIAAATCVFAVVEGAKNPVVPFFGNELNLWVVAVFAGACSAMFTALSFMRTFSIRVDTEGMASRVAGTRWRLLRVGAMPWKDIRSMHERTTDRVLEVRAAENRVFDIPMRVVNYPILRQHLENMVRLYGDRPAHLL
jgi:hypothetical protein